MITKYLSTPVHMSDTFDWLGHNNSDDLHASERQVPAHCVDLTAY